MSKVVALAKNDERLETANRWVIRMDEGLTADEEAALKAW